MGHFDIQDNSCCLPLLLAMAPDAKRVKAGGSVTLETLQARLQAGGLRVGFRVQG